MNLVVVAWSTVSLFVIWFDALVCDGIDAQCIIMFVLLFLMLLPADVRFLCIYSICFVNIWIGGWLCKMLEKCYCCVEIHQELDDEQMYIIRFDAVLVSFENGSCI